MGLFDFAMKNIGSIGSFLGGERANSANADINSAQMANNAAEAEKNRNFQERMRSTQYQTTVKDLSAAGLNPMLAYTNGGAGNISGATAQSGPMQKMENTSAAAVQGGLAAAQIENLKSQTEVNKAQEQKVLAEVPQTHASTGQILGNTERIKNEVNKIVAEIKNINMKTLNEEERVTLTRAQQQLTNAQARLAKGNLTLTEAKIIVEEAEGKIRKYQTEGAKNEYSLEKTLGTDSGNIGKIFQMIKGLTK